MALQICKQNLICSELLESFAICFKGSLESESRIRNPFCKKIRNPPISNFKHFIEHLKISIVIGKCAKYPNCQREKANLAIQ